MRKICTLIPLLLLLHPVEPRDLRADNFIHYSGMSSWAYAQALCRERHTDLVSIKDATENWAYFQGWIGLYRENSTSDWRWSRGNLKANFTNWAHNKENNGNCAYMYRNNEKWYSDDCDDGHSFMCYDERLVLVKKNKTWEGALKHCRSLQARNPNKPAKGYQNHLYDLATLRSKDDHDFAREKAQEATTNEVWTGLRYLAGQWVWVGGEVVQYQNMDNCPFEKFCGTLSKNNSKRYQNRNCTQRRNFFCYKKP